MFSQVGVACSLIFIFFGFRGLSAGFWKDSIICLVKEVDSVDSVDGVDGADAVDGVDACVDNLLRRHLLRRPSTPAASTVDTCCVDICCAESEARA